MTEEQAKYETTNNNKEDTPKKVTYYPGATITLTELQKKTAQAELDCFSQILRKSRKRLFDTLHDFHPELKDYHYEYYGDAGEIKIVAKKANNVEKKASA